MFNSKTSITYTPVNRSGDSMTGDLMTSGGLIATLLKVGTSTNTAALASSGSGGALTFTLPSVLGTSGQVLTTTGSGILSWTTPTLGTITSVVGGTGLTSTSGGGIATMSLNIATNTTLGGLQATTGKISLNATTGAITNVVANTADLATVASSANGLQGVPVTSASPTAMSQVLAYNSSTSQWAPASFTVASMGTDFSITSNGAIHSFSIPTASSSNRGLLSTSDWTTFNSKQGALGFTPVNKAGDSMTGALSLPSLSVTSNTFSVNGANLYVDTSSGQVGIGTTSPGGVLAVKAPSSSSGSPGIKVELNGSNLLVYKSINSSTVVENTGGGSLNLQAQQGNVGIGTTAPSQLLDVNGTAKATNLEAATLLRLNGSTSGAAGLKAAATSAVTWTLPGSDGSNGQVLSTNGSGILTWTTSSLGFTPVNKAGDTMTGLLTVPSLAVTSNTFSVNTDKLIVNSSGNVGIGTTSPGVKLDVAGNGKFTQSGAFSNAGLEVTGSDINVNIKINNTGGRDYRIISSTSPAGLRFYDNTIGTDRMIIDPSGNVGIGTVSPSAKLDVQDGHVNIGSYGAVEGMYYKTEAFTSSHNSGPPTAISPSSVSFSVRKNVLVQCGVVTLSLPTTSAGTTYDFGYVTFPAAYSQTPVVQVSGGSRAWIFPVSSNQSTTRFYLSHLSAIATGAFNADVHWCAFGPQ